MDIVDEVLKLKLPVGSYAVFGSGPMAVRGIRASDDVDLIVNDELYQKLLQIGWDKRNKGRGDFLARDNFEAHNNWNFGKYNPSTSDLINKAELINGVPFVPLNEVVKWKMAFARPKDLADLELIKKYLNNPELTKPQAIELINDFVTNFLPSVEWYKNVQPNISGILLYGSVAKGTNRPDSDIDILIILPLAIEEKYTKGEYFYDYKGQSMNIVLRSIERLRRIAKDNNDDFQKEVFRGAEIIEANKELKTLLQKIQTN